MAIVENFWLKNQRKRLAGAVIYQAMGQTRSRELATSVSNPRTPAQMSQRVRWSNCVNIYRVNQRWMKLAYETKKTNQTDYNKFMSLNVASNNISKRIAQAGGAIANAYIMTQGTLPSIQWTGTERNRYSNVYLETDDINTDEMTVAQFARELLNNNPGLREGDQLSLIINSQQFNSDTGVPFVLLREYEVLLNTSDNRSLWDFMPRDILNSAEQGEKEVLMISNTSLSGTFCMILSRTTAGKTYVSSQTSQIYYNETIIETYSSAAALQRAIDSYGESDDIFLTTTRAGENTDDYLPTSIVGLYIESQNVEYGTFSPGQRIALGDAIWPITITVMFSKAVSGSTGRLRLTTSQGRVIYLEPAAGSGAQWDFTGESGIEFRSNESLRSVNVTFGGQSFEAVFQVLPGDEVGPLD